MPIQVKIFIIALLCLAWLVPLATLAQPTEFCCVCKDTRQGGKFAGGPPSADSCVAFEENTFDCYDTVGGQKCQPGGYSISCEVANGSCSSWQAAFAKQAAEDADAAQYKRDLVVPKLQVGLPGFSGFLDKIKPEKIGDGDRQYYLIPWIGQYMNAIYKFAVGAGAVLAVVVIIVGGFIWMTSMGNQAMITLAKGYIGGAVVGLVILLTSFVMLKTLAPGLVNLQPIRLAEIAFQDLDDYLYGKDAVPTGGSAVAGAADGEDIPGIVCPKSGGESQLAQITQSTLGKITYRYGGRNPGQTSGYSGKDVSNPCPAGAVCLDCSAYVNHVLRCAGMKYTSVMATTKDIFSGNGAEKINDLTSTSINGVPLRPGDLVGSPGRHVGIYIGNGQIAQSTSGSGKGRQPGGAVVIGTLTKQDWIQYVNRQYSH